MPQFDRDAAPRAGHAVGRTLAFRPRTPLPAAAPRTGRTRAGRLGSAPEAILTIVGHRARADAGPGAHTIDNAIEANAIKEMM
ncbi:hypothetical protein ACFRCG_21985 [Embleya sp. NPDC056575]|uniref:hypothetical protein n=1 Tax=unclassified Embleya TaxID=2699296 RepID=UPI00369847CD